MSATRHKGRESALQILYQIDSGADSEEAVVNFFKHFALSEEGKDFAISLVQGLISNQTAIDAKISEHSDKWRLERMAVVDRNILRLAVYELSYAPEALPFKIVLDEWIEVAKRYGAEHSSAFVNGILNNML